MTSMKLAVRALTKAAIPALGAFMITTSAFGQTFDSNGDSSGTMTFNGFVDQGGTIIDGLTGELTITLVDMIDSTHWQFTYSLTNTSGAPLTASAITAFGFNSDAALDLSTSTIDDGFFTTIAEGQISQGPGFAVDICFKNGQDNNCAGSPGNQGVNMGENQTGTFTLEFVDPITSLTLSDYTLRYQAIAGPEGTPGSAIGQQTGEVPEPSTWAMMLLGFGAVGFAVRRSRKLRPVPQIA